MTVEDIPALRDDLRTVNTELEPGKSLALPPRRHHATQEKQRLLAESGVSFAHGTAIEGVRVPVGPQDYIRECMGTVIERDGRPSEGISRQWRTASTWTFS